MSKAEDRIAGYGKLAVFALVAAVAVAGWLSYRLLGGPACEQVEDHVAQELDQDHGARALDLADGAPEKCRSRGALRGRRAEALARVGRVEEASGEALQVLARDEGNAYATYALAQCEHAKGDFDGARRHAQAAVERGRGAPAHLLLGVVAYKQGDYAAARAAYVRVLEVRSDDVQATYNLALVDHQLDRYRDAREGYLKVLRLDPGNLDARFNLGLLTYRAGATLEARHHLEKLREMAPGDDRVKRLEAALSMPPPAPALIVGAPAASSRAGTAASGASSGAP
jgi:tetratricopeptide (TPR) repeat protein